MIPARQAGARTIAPRSASFDGSPTTKAAMLDSLVRFTGESKVTPCKAPIPYKHAHRWVAEREAEALPPAVPVFVSQKAFVRFCLHAGSDPDNEVGGWLVGRWCVDDATAEQFVVVEAILPAIYTRHGSAFLTFTHDSQLFMLDLMEQRYPDKELVGWYHTHPRMSVFLSGYDTWLHEHFFPKPWQVALVIEPHSTTGGFFIRNVDGNLNPRLYYGFYELKDGRDRTVVHWHNMKREELASLPAKEEQER